MPVASIYNQDYILPPLYQEMCPSCACISLWKICFWNSQSEH